MTLRWNTRWYIFASSSHGQNFSIFYAMCTRPLVVMWKDEKMRTSNRIHMWEIEPQYNNKQKTNKKKTNRTTEPNKKKKCWAKTMRIDRKKEELHVSFWFFAMQVFFRWFVRFHDQMSQHQSIRRTNNRAAIFKWITRKKHKKKKQTEIIIKTTTTSTTTGTLNKCNAISAQAMLICNLSYYYYFVA